MQICVNYYCKKYKTVTNTVQNIYPSSPRCWKFVACRVIHTSPMQTIQGGLPLVRGRRALCHSCMFGQRAVFEIQRSTSLSLGSSNYMHLLSHSHRQQMQITLVLSREPSGSEAELYPCLLKTVCFCFHPQRYCCIISWFNKLQGGLRVVITELPVRRISGIHSLLSR